MIEQYAKGNGFCTFCMDRFDPSRIASHVKRCRDRRDDAACIQLRGRPHPMAFLLMVKMEDHSDGWVCLEAHGEASLGQLDQCLRQIWLPKSGCPGLFAASGKMQRRLGAHSRLEARQNLASILVVKDRFSWTVAESALSDEVRIEVIGYLPTAIMNCMIDVVAFPSGTDSLRWRPIGNPWENN